MDFGYSRASHSDSDSDDSSQFSKTKRPRGRPITSTNDISDFGYIRAQNVDDFSLSSNDSSDDDEYDDDDDDECGNNMTEEQLRKLTNEQLKVKLKAKNMPVSGNKAILVDRLLYPGKYKKKQPWKKSKAKALLMKLLQDRDSRLHNMTPRQVYESHKWYQDYSFDRFKENLKSIKHSIEENFAIVDSDIQIVREELRNFPQSRQGCRGYPRWDKHPAKSLLREDIKEGKYKLGNAKRFQLSRAEYSEFPSSVFRDHIHQERRRQREKKMKVIQRNKKAQKAHQKEVDESEAAWLANEEYQKELEEMISAMKHF